MRACSRMKRGVLVSARMSTSYEATAVETSEMVLEREGTEVTIRIGPRTLMSSDVHDSEDELGRLVAAEVSDIVSPQILIGGLGLGFTLRAALDDLASDARVDVAELMADVVRWNREDCGVYAGRPLDDSRVNLYIEDVAAVLARSEDTYDAIALDVDNGPSAITHPDNEKLYKRAGLARTRKALRPGGVLLVWSSFPSRSFTRSLEVIGSVELVRTAPAFAGAPRYYIWLARKPA
jgi:spermidine synthase